MIIFKYIKIKFVLIIIELYHGLIIFTKKSQSNNIIIIIKYTLQHIFLHQSCIVVGMQNFILFSHTTQINNGMNNNLNQLNIKHHYS